MGYKEDAILEAVGELSAKYQSEELLRGKDGRNLPNRAAVIDIVRDMRAVMFPGYFGYDTSASIFPKHYLGYRLNDLFDRLCAQIRIALRFSKEIENEKEEAERITAAFIKKLPKVQELLLKDVQAGFDGDPAAKSKEEVVFSYPGFMAIYTYRIAHLLYEEGVPFIPRIMTEYAHGKTGIDINPGADIGEYFFIDHGTGVVIGETTTIGNNVKLYQGVTLGALSTRKGQQLSGVKRHPTIGDNVTIYANSTVLGGETVIGENSIVAGNTFITESIPANTKVSAKSPELVMKQPQPQEEVWCWEI